MEKKNNLSKKKSYSLTLRLPNDLKSRLEKQALIQGVSINQLVNYIINCEITQLELISKLETGLSKKSITQLENSAKKIMDKIPSRNVPVWDKIM
jgi:hypothetical protein